MQQSLEQMEQLEQERGVLPASEARRRSVADDGAAPEREEEFVAESRALERQARM